MTDARDFLTVRLAKDDRVDDVGGMVFVELEDSQGRSIDWPNRYTDNSGHICIDIPVNGESIIESQRAEIERLMWERDTFSEFINDNSLDCLSSCDSIAHDEFCPQVSPKAAYINAMKQIEQLQQCARLKHLLDVAIADRHHENFPNHAHDDSLTSVDLMSAEIKCLRNANKQLQARVKELEAPRNIYTPIDDGINRCIDCAMPVYDCECN